MDWQSILASSNEYFSNESFDARVKDTHITKPFQSTKAQKHRL